MSNNSPQIDTNALAQNSQKILDAIMQQTQLDRFLILNKLLEIVELDITIAGDTQKIHNLELITEYPNVQYTKTMVKNETWRKTVAEVLHIKDINDADKIVGYMDTQFIIKMISHRRKRAHEVINALRNIDATAEVIPQNTRKKKFLGLG